jgi:serine/threonine protein kinase
MTQPRLIGGRYELGELIGYGGMAEVHRGRDVRLGREVAIKVLRADLARDPSFLNRFRREAQAAAALNHPSIVSVYDTGEDVGTGGAMQPYIVMEYVEGRTLRDILKSEGRLPARRAMEIGADVCGALEFSHRNGLVHRDVKPANVMITPSGAVKVMDFGIARAVADNSATVTQTANVIGTAQYLSPEQARGESVDARSDVYSTGCLLYELVTGTPPFQGDSPVAVAYQHVRENAAAPSSRVPGLPRALDSIVMKALAKNPLNRYQTTGEMRADLQRALADEPVSAETVMTDAERTQFIARTPPPPMLPPRRGSEPIGDPEQRERRGWLIWMAVAIAVLLVIGLGVWGFSQLNKNSTTPTKQIAVPARVIGMSERQAKATLSRLGFTPVNGGVKSKCYQDQHVAKGDVCDVQPAVGEQVSADPNGPGGSKPTATYYLYSPATAQVPYVVGMQYAKAQQKIHDAHLVPQQKSVNSAQPAGTVVRQNPAAYSPNVSPGSTVVLSVSTGKIKLKNVVGQPIDKAKAELNQRFTNVDDSQSKTTHVKKRDGIVAEENPTPGLTYSPDTKITLVVYRYVVPPPPPTTFTCTPAPSTSPSSPTGSSSPPTGSSSATGSPSPGPTQSSSPARPITAPGASLPTCPTP